MISQDQNNAEGVRVLRVAGPSSSRESDAGRGWRPPAPGAATSSRAWRGGTFNNLILAVSALNSCMGMKQHVIGFWQN